MPLSKPAIVAISALGILLIILLSWWVCKVASSPALHFSRVESETDHSKMLNVPPRRMWGWGGWVDSMAGYCGESSFQMVALYHGNYFSQEQILKAGAGTFLVGINDDVCCANLHLKGNTWPTDTGPNIYDLLNYCKKQVDAELPVIIGLFCNEPTGDPSYDHQCVITGYDMGGNDKYPNTLYLNDTYNMSHWPLDCSPGPYKCESFGADCPTPPPVGGNDKYLPQPYPKCYQRREDFAAKDAKAPYNVAIPNVLGVKDGKNNAINATLTVTGNVDPNGELFPCWLEMDSLFEPNWGAEDQVYATPTPINCKVYIEGLHSGQKYSLLRFDNPADVPDKGDFIHSKTYTFREDFTAKGSLHMVDVRHDLTKWPFWSNGTYFFRCVKNTAPATVNFPYGTDRTDQDLGPMPPKPDAVRVARAKLSASKARVAMAVRGRTSADDTHFPTEWKRRVDTLQRIASGKEKLKKGGLIAKMMSDRGYVPLGLGSSYAKAMADDYKRVSATDAKAKAKCSNGPTVDAEITCGDIGTGKIHEKWEWTFPVTNWDGSKSLGCLPVSIKPAEYGSVAKTCLRFTLSDPDDKTITADNDSGSIGLDGNLYIEDFASPWYYSFSVNGKNPDGSWTMVSQDGVTISTIRPVS
jgi:hypothetical protein